MFSTYKDKRNFKISFRQQFGETYMNQKLNIMKDKNGNTIEEGDTVIVPEPNETDNHNHSFVGRVHSFRGDNVIVIDSEDDGFEIEPERLEIEGL